MKKFNRIILPPFFGIVMLLILIGVAIRPPIARAAGPWYVSPTGNDGNDCLSSGTACQTIGGAIGKASSGDTINIAAGTYTETNIISGKALTLVGAGIDQTIVNGSTSSIFSIYSNASVNISNLTLRNGSADSGAAIYAAGPTVISQIRVTNNTSNFGTIYVWSTTVTIADSTISGNHVGSGSRDGVFADTNAKLLISNSTFSGNQGESIHLQNISTAAITNITFSGNGGLAAIVVSANSTATINASTIANNNSYGILDDGAVTIQNSILYNNDSTFASGTENNCASNYALTPTSGGYNIDGGTSCGFSATGDITSTNPTLLPLGDYGGSTQTHGLSLNSPAIDAGSPTTCPATDQRGITRPQDGDGDATATCDIGAFELVRQAPISVTITGDSSGLVNSNHTFVATVSPVTTTQPITYVWQATNQTTITNTGKGITDAVSFTWTGTGAQVVTVTVNNGLGTQTDTHAFIVTAGTQAITGVTISGATSGSLAGTYTFNADVLPSNATQPITYTWQADGQSPVTHTGKGITDSVTFQWTTEGTKTITVTATNEVGSQVDTHTIRLWSWYVNDATGNDGNDCQSAGTACKTIGGAVGKVADGDTITVATGTYTETNILNKSLIIIGAGVDQTVVDGNAGGTIFTIGAGKTVNISGMTLKNGALGTGGAIISSGDTTLSQMKFTGNTGSAGAIYVSAGTLTLKNSMVDGNTGGSSAAAVWVDGTSNLVVENSTIANNNSSGLHIQSSGAMTLTNVTVSGNSYDGIQTSSGNTAIQFSTIAKNTTSGILNYGTITIESSIVADNNGGTNCVGSGTLTSSGYNIDSGTSCGFSGLNDQLTTAPLLLPLADNGGDSWTHGLPLNSPAIDAGKPETCPATDQRGITRPVDGNGDTTATCDIGAFEFVRQAVAGVEISGNANGFSNSSETFTAAVTPISASIPITYVWQATNQTPVTHTGQGITDTVSFNWSSTGTQVVTVTVDNGIAQQSNTHTINLTQGTQAITGVTISGATSGSTGPTYTFNATVSPSNATQPITYTWQADEQSTVVHTGQGTTDSVDFHWNTAGTKNITVTVDNGLGTQTDAHTIVLSSWYVNGASGSDSNDCLSLATACKTIGGAMGKASNSDTITIAAGTYPETLSVNKSLTFIGAGRDQTIVDGGASDSVFDIPLNTSITLSDMTIRNGSGRGGGGDGGGIYVFGALTLSQVRVFSNTGNLGGAVFVSSTGSLTATNTTFDQNATQTNGNGTIFVDGGKLWLENSTVSGNRTNALHNQSGGTVDIFNSTISGNAGGVYNGATLTMRNSTVANNSAGNAISNSGTFTVKSSILAAPSGVDVCDTLSSGAVNLTSQGYNLESTDTCGLNATGDKTGMKPYLQSLADNGGNTWTHALLRPSPALDGSDSSVCPATDQRGTARPVDGDGNGTATCDIGAFESAFVPWKIYLPLVIK